MPLPPLVLPAGFVAPCRPNVSPASAVRRPVLHGTKHDGFRAIARKDGGRVKLYTRPGDET